MIIAASWNKYLTREVFNSYLMRLKDYHQIKGLIYLCSASMISKELISVKGYYYDPNDSITPWKKGKFPYPNAVFNKALLNKTYDHLMKFTNNRVFNSKKINKWQFWSLLSNNPDIRKVLPYTENVTSLLKLEQMLSKYGVLYVKPVGSSRGRGIMRVEKISDQYIVTISRQKTIKYNENEMIKFIKNLRKKLYRSTRNPIFI